MKNSPMVLSLYSADYSFSKLLQQLSIGGKHSSPAGSARYQQPVSLVCLPRLRVPFSDLERHKDWSSTYGVVCLYVCLSAVLGLSVFLSSLVCLSMRVCMYVCTDNFPRQRDSCSRTSGLVRSRALSLSSENIKTPKNKSCRSLLIFWGKQCAVKKKRKTHFEGVNLPAIQ